jgi:hypothetical protein
MVHSEHSTTRCATHLINAPLRAMLVRAQAHILAAIGVFCNKYVNYEAVKKNHHLLFILFYFIFFVIVPQYQKGKKTHSERNQIRQNKIKTKTKQNSLEFNEFCSVFW